MGNGGDPFAGEADVGACLLGESFGHARRVEEGPFEFVGEELVLQVDVEVDDAAIGVVGVENI